METTIEEFQLIPTPAAFVGDVYGLLARLMADDGGEDGGAAAEEIALTPELVRRMYEESQPAHRRLFKYLAERPDTWIHSDALAQGLKLQGGSKSLAGMLGAFGRRAKHRYNGLRPYISEWDHGAGQVRHLMPGEVAKVIVQL